MSVPEESSIVAGSCYDVVCASNAACCGNEWKDPSCFEQLSLTASSISASDVEQEEPQEDMKSVLLRLSQQQQQANATTAIASSTSHPSEDETSVFQEANSYQQDDNFFKNPHHCFEANAEGLPGCSNPPTCDALVCEASSSLCCTSAWTEDCVDLAYQHCTHLEPRLDVLLDPSPPAIYQHESGMPCPLGFVCDDRRLTRCEDVRRASVEVYLLGDLYAGIYCPFGENGYMNCPAGSYCPNATTQLDCPSGYYCPHKSAQFDLIACPGCETGATDMQRDMYGYYVLAGLVVLLLVGKKGYDWIENRRQRQAETRKRVARKQELDRILPRLRRMTARLHQLSNHVPLSHGTTAASPARFNVNDLFLQVQAAVRSPGMTTTSHDVDKPEEEVSYADLNRVMELTSTELREFQRRMNERAHRPADYKTVTQATLTRHFYPVLDHATRLSMTREDAANLFDQIVQASNSSTTTPEILPEVLYDSVLADFLSDVQVYSIARKLGQLSAPPQEQPPRRQGSWRVGQQDHSSSTTVTYQDGLDPPATAAAAAAGMRPEQPLQQRPQSGAISKEIFVEHYPRLLLEATLDAPSAMKNNGSGGDKKLPKNQQGVDIAFVDLSLTVKVGKKTTTVLDKVTGRIAPGSLTAILGSSGAGKTSLLNALCGRAFYGEKSGKTYVNGHLASIEEHRRAVGFVPQDDIVSAELTVRENFIFSGKFRLPRGTPLEEIEELADETMANLGLSRVANSLVGSVKRRGVSGGERKRVNIGLELMARPVAIFLDEPTSGLDASSALLVMKTLKHLADIQGVTVCSAIHQPRKFIYDLFDSLVLLGVGGRMVYHGPTHDAQPYFERLNYVLPRGESVADWLLDISSGRLEPEIVAPSRNASRFKRPKTLVAGEFHVATTTSHRGSQAYSSGDIVLESINKDAVSGGSSADMDLSSRSENEPYQVVPMMDADIVSTSGISAGKADMAFEEATARREWLYQQWDAKLMASPMIVIPTAYDLPRAAPMPSFLQQLKHQVTRALLTSWRNGLTRLLDAVVVVVAVVLVSLFDGPVKVTVDFDPLLSFEEIVRPTEENMMDIIPQIFSFSLTWASKEYGLKVGMITTVLLGLLVARSITERKMEFFREAASGYDVTAYYISINVVATLEHSCQILVAAFFGLWLRNSFASAVAFYVNFLLLAWIAVSWAILLAIIVPPDNVNVIVGCFMGVSGLLFSGGLLPIVYYDTYRQGGITELFSGLVSPMRYFVEMGAVAEARCLLPQTGYTLDPNATNYPLEFTSMALLGYGINDLGNVTQQSCDGWYGTVLPAIFAGLCVRVLGLGAIHVFGRSKQIKKPLWHGIRNNRRLLCIVLLYVEVLVILYGLTSWLVLRHTSESPELIALDSSPAK